MTDICHGHLEERTGARLPLECRGRGERRASALRLRLAAEEKESLSVFDAVLLVVLVDLAHLHRRAALALPPGEKRHAVGARVRVCVDGSVWRGKWTKRRVEKRGGWDRFGNSLAFEPKKPRGKRGELLSERQMTEGKEGPGFVQLGIGDFICGSWAVIVSLNTLRYPM